MPQAAQHHPYDVASRATLASAINAARRLKGVRGDQLVQMHQAAAGRAAADRAKDGLAASIASIHGGTREDFCQRVKAKVPSAKPCRMQGYPEGMRDTHARQELRAGDIAGWGWDKLAGVVEALDYELVVAIRPRVRTA